MKKLLTSVAFAAFFLCSHIAYCAAKVPMASSANCRVSIDPGTQVGDIVLTEKTSTAFLVACMVGGFKSIGTVDISDNMRALTPAQEKLLLDKGFKTVILENGDIGISSNQQALDRLVAAYKLPDGPNRDTAIGQALAFTIIRKKEDYKKEMVLKKFCQVYCK